MMTSHRPANPSGVMRATWITAWPSTVSLLFYLSAVVMTASLFLGGGTQGGFLSDAILQLLAIPLLLLSLGKMFEVPLTGQPRRALWFCLAIAGLPLIQLIPLPPWLWTMLPHRQPSAEAFDIVGHAVPWMPISVSPELTWLSLLSLLPPIAIFLATLLLPYRERRWLSLIVLAIGILSVFVGFIQVAQGPQSPLRLFEFTNPTEAVGFFANRNHFAALIYVLTLFAAAWGINAAVRERSRTRYDTASILAFIGCFTLLVVLLAGEAMARSRAGLGLTIVGLFGAYALGASDRRMATGVTANKLLFGAMALAIVFSVQTVLYRILERFGVDALQDDRPLMVQNTIEAARAYMPLGSGMGTFVPVYAMFEKEPSFSFANRAHNDVLEVWLETGVVGPILIGLFVVWLLWRAVKIWRSAPPFGAREIDWSLARAATVILALVLAHSFVDYPLRTGAMMVVVAFACALLIEPPLGPENVLQASQKRTRQRAHSLEPSPALSRRPSVQTTTVGHSEITPRRRGSGGWGADVQWPKEWRQSSELDSPAAGDESPSTKPRP
jgi:O-antigen ligase